MVTTKPIKVDDEIKKILDNMKKYPRETYNDTLRRVLKLNGIKKKEKNGKKNNNKRN